MGAPLLIVLLQQTYQRILVDLIWIGVRAAFFYIRCDDVFAPQPQPTARTKKPPGWAQRSERARGGRIKARGACESNYPFWVLISYFF